VSEAARARLFVALDVPTLAEAIALVERLGEDATQVKVGLELFTAAGPEAIRALTARGRRVFLDLKLHDIPETARRSAAAAAAHGASWLTVHAAGGRAMLEAAVAGAGPGCAVLAVTVLTSLEEADLAADGQSLPLAELVRRRAELAIAAGCAGVVCSPNEAAAIRAAIGAGPLVVTPGVRPSGAALGDQKRVDTPSAARAAGASAVVVGRPIRDAADPRAAIGAILAELAQERG
jgi:orotidine-5'-phosphate decarboxylase